MTDVLARPAAAPKAPAPKPAPTTTPDDATRADLARFRLMLGRYLAGDLDEDVFRVFRLNNGVYGQRQQGHNQMLRCKVPCGSLLPEQLEMFA
jgi:sulfite reductase beta subunit-like hemoprotein